jgi:hypothetical protein
LEATVNSLRNVINTRWVISKKCKNTRWQLSNGVWDDKRKKFEEGSSGPKEAELDEFMEDDMIGHCDNLAALMYLNRFINWRENPAPSYNLNHELKASRDGNYTVKPQSQNQMGSIFKVRKF